MDNTGQLGSAGHLGHEELERGLGWIRSSPADHGTVDLIVRRPAVEEREVITEAVIDEAEGLVGDCWRTRGSSSTPDGSASPEAQITLMNVRCASAVAGGVAGGEDRRPLAGDQLYVDLDLSVANLPPGSRIQAGSAVLEISAKPHTGCKKFMARFGEDALRFVNQTGRELRLRGVNARVIRGGVVRTGDTVVKLP